MIKIYLRSKKNLISQKNLRSQKKSQISQKFSKKMQTHISKNIRFQKKISHLMNIIKKNADPWKKKDKPKKLVCNLNKYTDPWKKNRHKFGRIRAGNRVGLVGGWMKFGRIRAGNRVGFVGGWMVGCVFFLHTPISELIVYPNYARSSLAPSIIELKDKKVGHHRPSTNQKK